ncbi:hypothetical protein HDU85_004783 [Gaertneriomyces sp. JEL0708]|nr:hypothetical protein HDU85_004783 [Gaertneriomyces sp. JEL0708]
MVTYDASFLSAASPFVQEVIATLASHHIPVHYKIDHVCYRTSSPNEYSNLKALLSTFGDLLIESEIGGRDISTYKLRDDVAIRVPGREAGRDRVIDVLELPAPKPGRNYQSGWEHVELVVDDMSLEEFMAEVDKSRTELGSPPLDWDLSGIHKPLNRDVRLVFEAGFSVKFHEQTLEEVIAFEKRAMEGESRAI